MSSEKGGDETGILVASSFWLVWNFASKSERTPNAEPSLEVTKPMDVERMQASLGASTSRGAMDIQTHSRALELVASPLWIYDSTESSNLWGNR